MTAPYLDENNEQGTENRIARVRQRVTRVERRPTSFAAGASGPFAHMIMSGRSVLTGDGWDVNENVDWDSIDAFGGDATDYFSIYDDSGKPVININDPDPIAGVWAYWFNLDCIGTAVTATVARLPAAMRACAVTGVSGAHPTGLLLNDADYRYNAVTPTTEMNVPAGTAVPGAVNSDHLNLHSSGIAELTGAQSITLNIATTGGIRDWSYSATMYLIRLCGFSSYHPLYP